MSEPNPFDSGHPTPPYLLPRSLATAAVTPAAVTGWGSLADFTDHQRFCEAARGETNLRLHFSATATYNGTPLPPPLTHIFTGTDDKDSLDGSPFRAGRVPKFVLDGTGFLCQVYNDWDGAFFDLFADRDGGIQKLRPRGTTSIVVADTSTLPDPDRFVFFFFDPTDIASADANDLVSSFDFFGTTVAFMAREPSLDDTKVTAAAIVATET